MDIKNFNMPTSVRILIVATDIIRANKLVLMLSPAAKYQDRNTLVIGDCTYIVMTTANYKSLDGLRFDWAFVQERVFEDDAYERSLLLSKVAEVLGENKGRCEFF